MAGTDKQKQSLYFPLEMLGEITREANRLDRSLSWIVQQAWRLARQEVGKFPSMDVRNVRDPNRPPSPVVGTEPRRDPSEPPVEREPSAQVRDFIRGKFENL